MFPRHRHWGHHHHHHGRRFGRPMGPIGRFVRAKLRRRIFAWFLGGIVTTMFVMALLMFLVARVQEPEWARSFERSRGWVGKQFARDWNDPVARERFAREAGADLDANLDLYDANGALLLSTSGGKCARAMFDAPVLQNDVQVGLVKVCLARPNMAPWRAFAFGLLCLVAVWKISGRIARRLAGPLDQLTETVKRIGTGDLRARTELDCYEPDEIGVVADAVNDMAGRIEKQMADQRELLATVSHELRTPLARLRIISEIARDTGATARTFDELDREVVEMDALVGELLANSRLEFGQISKRDLSLRDLATRSVERAGLPATALAVNGEGDSVQGDPTLLQRALANLFDNANKHGKGADALEVTVSANEVKFEVLDRGPGIEGNGQALFEKFNKGQDGQGADGLGLGLALVKRIATAHGGTTWATSREGGGARVGFSIQRA
ncbi:MAG TPA: HAMP domain-containing sensor histidine kinase [Archangium sp.]